MKTRGQDYEQKTAYLDVVRNTGYSIVFFAFLELLEPYRSNYANFGVLLLSIVLITGGLFVTLKGKKDKKPKE